MAFTAVLPLPLGLSSNPTLGEPVAGPTSFTLANDGRNSVALAASGENSIVLTGDGRNSFELG